MDGCSVGNNFTPAAFCLSHLRWPVHGNIREHVKQRRECRVLVALVHAHRNTSLARRLQRDILAKKHGVNFTVSSWNANPSRHLDGCFSSLGSITLEYMTTIDFRRVESFPSVKLQKGCHHMGSPRLSDFIRHPSTASATTSAQLIHPCFPPER